MITRFHLPHRFKKIGLSLFIIGFIGWLWGQSDGSARVIKSLVAPSGELVTYHPLTQNQYELNTGFLLSTFFGCILGLALLILSKERNEDEYSQKLKLESYQFAAIFQFILILVLLVVRVLTGSDIMETLIVELGLSFIFLFWVVYLIRFNLLMFLNKRALKRS